MSWWRRARARAPRKPHKAFTLVELLVTLALSMMLVGVAAFIFLQVSEVQHKVQRELEAALRIRNGLELLAQDMRCVQVPWEPTMDFKVTANDGDDGYPRDVLEYTALDIGTRSPRVVRLEVDDNGYLVRTIVRAWNPDGGGWEDVNQRSSLGGQVRGFRVEYAWPDANGSWTYLRSAPPGSGLSPDDGSLFVFRSAGPIDDDGLLRPQIAWDGANPAPPQMARTIHVFHPDAGGTYPVLRVDPDGTLALQAPRADDTQFVMPLLPKTIRVTITHAQDDGRTRSLQRVIPVLY